MITISKGKLKAHLLEILRELEQSGEEVIVTDRNRPVARITPIRNGLTIEEAFADVYGQMVVIEDLDAPTIEEWGELTP
ncbi:MAG: type II toxin-antitoxin system prevent-host-death family antitoxin [Caldilinea sp.]|nr:type II toxin-antitoxin system prevent-host-death family antitoxin [Caldilinea sp.]MDW8442321.1 type II toxin-antitoxin system prevent-host-death family antitoxin [Caldilineaceae bacterium]